ncbi:MAG: His-Xaa-Ser system radical SAM maturase HxsC, partial [Candidatus Omnitrophota bacterium]
DYVERLVRIGHPNIFIEIPLYADTDTEHNGIIRAKGFYQTIKGLYNLAVFKQRVGLRIVILKQNYQRLAQLAEFIYHNFPFVFHIAFMQMETVGLAWNNIEDLWIDPYDYNDQLKEAVNYLAMRKLRVSIYNAQLCILPRTLWKYSRKSISRWKNIYVEECRNCDYRNECGGFFASSLGKHSQHIKGLKKA